MIFLIRREIFVFEKVIKLKEIQIKRYKGSLLLKVSVLGLMLFFGVMIVRQNIQIGQMQEQTNEYKALISAQELTNAQLELTMDENEFDKDSFAEDYAREEFGYAKNDERVFVNIGGN